MDKNVIFHNVYENKYSQFDRLPAYENFRKQTEYSSITLSENKSTGTQNKKVIFIIMRRQNIILNILNDSRLQK